MPFPEVYFTLLYLSDYADLFLKSEQTFSYRFAMHNTKQMAYRWAQRQSGGKADTGLLESNRFQSCCKIDFNQNKTKTKKTLDRMYSCKPDFVWRQ